MEGRSDPHDQQPPPAKDAGRQLPGTCWCPQTPQLDITSDEVLVARPVQLAIGHQDSDAPLPGDGVACYSLTELFGKKLRALTDAADRGTSTTWSTCIAIPT